MDPIGEANPGELAFHTMDRGETIVGADGDGVPGSVHGGDGIAAVHWNVIGTSEGGERSMHVEPALLERIGCLQREYTHGGGHPVPFILVGRDAGCTEYGKWHGKGRVERTREGVDIAAR